MASSGNWLSQGRFFTTVEAIANISSTKAAHLNWQTRSSNLQRKKTKSWNSRISLKLPHSHIRMLKPPPKGTMGSETMLLHDSQPRVVLRQCLKTKANCRATIWLSAIKLSSGETRWYKGERRRRPTKHPLATKSRALLLSFLILSVPNPKT